MFFGSIIYLYEVIYIYIYIYMYILYIYMYVYIYIYMYVCMYVYKYIYIYNIQYIIIWCVYDGSGSIYLHNNSQKAKSLNIQQAINDLSIYVLYFI